MLKEARKERYLIDGFTLKNFHRYPSGVDPNNLLYEQQIFFMYLTALSPSLDEVRSQVSYLDEKEELDNSVFEDFFDTKLQILELEARTKGISIEEHKEQLILPARKKALEDLDEKYGFKVNSENDDPREIVRQKYRKALEKQKNAINEVDQQKLDKIKAASQLFNMPENSISGKKE